MGPSENKTGQCYWPNPDLIKVMTTKMRTTIQKSVIMITIMTIMIYTSIQHFKSFFNYFFFLKFLKQMCPIHGHGAVPNILIVPSFTLGRICKAIKTKQKYKYNEPSQRRFERCISMFIISMTQLTQILTLIDL